MAQTGNKGSKKTEKVTAADIVDALTDRFSDMRQYIRGFEVGLTTGGACRRIDCVIMDCYASHGFRVEGIEIKISRSDLRRELEDNGKHAAFYKNLDYFSLAAPREIIDKDIIPKTWGIYEYVDGTLGLVRRPLMLHDVPITTMDKGFAASFMRSFSYRERSTSEIEKAVREAEHEAYKRGRENAQEELGGPFLHEKLERLAKYDRMFMYAGGSRLEALESLAEVVNRTSLLYLYDELNHLDKNIRHAMRILKNEGAKE